MLFISINRLTIYISLYDIFNKGVGMTKPWKYFEWLQWKIIYYRTGWWPKFKLEVYGKYLDFIIKRQSKKIKKMINKIKTE